MSKENVEIVRRSFAAYDSGGLDALAEFWHPDIDWRAVEGYIDDVGRIRGPDGLRQYYRQWEETFDAVRVEIEELTEAGDEVVALLRGVGRMKGSDAEIDIRYAVVISIRDGKIARGREYSTREEALEAAGLSE
jgi:uncharacterized protein